MKKRIMIKFDDCIDCPHVDIRREKDLKIPIWYCKKSKRIIIKRYWDNGENAGIIIPKWCELENA